MSWRPLKRPDSKDYGLSISSWQLPEPETPVSLREREYRSGYTALMTSFNSELGFQTGQGTATITLDTRPERKVAPGVIHFAVI